MNIKTIINNLNLLYYDFEEKDNILVLDENYTNRYTKLEFTKITYHLSKKNIQFDVARNGSMIKINQKINLKDRLQNLFKNFKLKQQNIFILNDEKVDFAKNIPLFKIKYIKKEIDFSAYDYLIFTSKNAVKAINQNNKKWKNIPSLAISQQTAKTIKDLNGNLDFVGCASHGDEFAKEIINKLKNKKVLYIRGNKCVSNLVNILKDNDIFCKEEIVYENIFNNLKNKIKLPKNSKIIFSSPSTIKYFLESFSWENSYTAICIGKTTAKYFPSQIKPIIADKTSLKACVQKALELK